MNMQLLSVLRISEQKLIGLGLIVWERSSINDVVTFC